MTIFIPLLLNLLFLAVLTLSVRTQEWLVQLRPCVSPWIVALGTAIIGLESLHVAWRWLGPEVRSHLSEERLSKLRQTLVKNFSEKELCALASELNVEDRVIQGKDIESRARSLLHHLEEQNRIQELVELGKEKKTGIQWPQVPVEAAQDIESEMSLSLTPPFLSLNLKGKGIVRQLVTLAAVMHPRELPTAVLLGQALVVVALVLTGLSHYSPFRVQEPPITIQHFRVQYAGGSSETLASGELLELSLGEMVWLEVIPVEAEGISCTWSAVRGVLNRTGLCMATYSAPFDGGRDSLSVVVRSRCRSREVSAGLHIQVVP